MAKFAPAPIMLAEVTDPAWLSAALSRPGKPVDVADARIVEKLGPTATKVRLKLDFAAPPPDDMPQGVCIKGFFDVPDSPYLASGMQAVEAAFYRDCAPHLSVHVPRALHSGTDDTTKAGVTVMEDLKLRGTNFLTALSPYTPEQAKESLDQLARLHGGTWNGRDHGRYPFVESKIDFLYNQRLVPPARVTELLHGERGEGLPEAVRDGERVYEALGRMATPGADGRCFIHGDCHAGNVFESPEGIGLIDWQLLQQGDWAMDVAYHITAILTVEDRRRSEQDLLRHYLDRLAAHGGTPPTWDAAWENYRRSVPYGYFLWGITVRVDPPIIRQFVERLGTAVADHESFERLGV